MTKEVEYSIEPRGSKFAGVRTMTVSGAGASTLVRVRPTYADALTALTEIVQGEGKDPDIVLADLIAAAP